MRQWAELGMDKRRKKKKSLRLAEGSREVFELFQAWAMTSDAWPFRMDSLSPQRRVCRKLAGNDVRLNAIIDQPAVGRA
jgi:hypothetical protein